MTRRCFACARVGSEDDLDVYVEAKPTYRRRWSPVELPLIIRDSPKLDLAREHSPIRRSSSFHSSSGQEKRDDNLLRPDIASDVPRAVWHQEKPRLSGSAPSVTYSTLEREPALTPSTCRSRQKKFLRHFNVDPEEMVIDYYSCALVADILLQGHLYISKNYFAFYSNVFGYVTKLLIPTTSVVNVTKEKTAFILPNAVGVATPDNRHVFSSLLSRDTTYRLMIQVWRAALIARTPDIIAVSEPEVDGSPCESSISGSEPALELKLNSKSPVPTLQEDKESTISSPAKEKSIIQPTVKRNSMTLSTLLLAVATILLIALFISASLLMYRVAELQISLSSRHSSRSVYEMQEILETNLNYIYKVRQSFEALAMGMEDKKDKLVQKKSEITLENANVKTIENIIIDPEVLLETEDAALGVS